MTQPNRGGRPKIGKQKHFSVDPDLDEWLTQTAAEQGITWSRRVRDILRDAMKRDLKKRARRAENGEQP